jgi:hypothetical protein
MDDDEREYQSISQLKEECEAMTKILKKLQREEMSLIHQNKILAREAINLGYHDSFGTGTSDGTTSTTGTNTGSGTVNTRKKKA